jgi:hypothetical protein
VASLPPLIEPGPLVARLGVDAEELDQDRLTAAREDASALVRSFVAPETWVDDDGELEEVPDDVLSVCLAVARRAYENPRGAGRRGALPDRHGTADPHEV